MSWDLQLIQSQVQFATRNEGLADKTTRWANRTIMEISTSAYFGKNLKRLSQLAIASGSATITSAWNNVTPNNIVNIHRIMVQGATTDTLFYNPLSRVAVRELYAFFNGGAATVSADKIDHYAIARWNTNATTQLSPEVAIYPNENAARALEVHYLAAPEKLATGTDTNWILRRYPQVVLAGSLRRAFLYLGNVPRYMRARSEFMSGIRDITNQELGDVAYAPVMQAVVSEYLRRMS